MSSSFAEADSCGRYSDLSSEDAKVFGVVSLYVGQLNSGTLSDRCDEEFVQRIGIRLHED